MRREIGGPAHYTANRKPDWLRIRPPVGDFSTIKNALRKRNLHTVCEECHCPNMAECWAHEGTATFLLMGDVCTRGCKFCHIKTGNPRGALDPHEPENLAGAIAEMKLDYAVLTSVTRDDLPDGGAAHFAQCIRAIKREHPSCLVEALTPDFRGDENAIKAVIDSGLDVFAHNLETVERLQRPVRDPRANYAQSLAVLRAAKTLNPRIVTKSSLMLGLGETQQEVLQAFRDLRAAGVDIITLGQYQRPSNWHLEVKEWVTPETFDRYKQHALDAGFLYCAAGPLVRSSYRAGELFIKHVLKIDPSERVKAQSKTSLPIIQ